MITPDEIPLGGSSLLLKGCFDMFEMEYAAKTIIEICKRNNSWDEPLSLSFFLIRGTEVGYLNLLYSGWLKKGNYSSEFKVNDKFIERLTEYFAKKEKK